MFAGSAQGGRYFQKNGFPFRNQITSPRNSKSLPVVPQPGSENIIAVQEHKTIRLEILINTPAPDVWAALTRPELIAKWMLDTPIEIVTEWREGGNRLEQGDLHGLAFENRGKIARFDPPKTLEYTHWSTLSIVPDLPENYSSIRFDLQEIGNQTVLTLSIRNLLTFEIFKHMEFYWKTALHMLKEVAESQ